jgi:hypothetical protein
MDEQEALKFSAEASQLYRDGNIEKSLLYYKKALEIFRALKNVGAEAGTLLYMADIYLESKDFKSAEEHYQLALKSYKKVKDKIGEGYALTGFGVLNEKKGNYEESRSQYRKAIKKFKKVGDPERAATVTSLIAGTFEAQEAWEDALMEYKESSRTFKKTGNQKLYNRKIRDLKASRKKHMPSKRSIITVIGYLLALILAETVTTYYGVKVGLAMHACILFALLLQSSMEASPNFANLLRSMMVLPLIRIIGLSIPMMQIKPLYWYPIIAIPLFAASYTIMKAQGLSRKNVGLVLGSIPIQIVIASSGVFLGTIEYFILKPKPLIPVFNPEMVLFAGIILLVATGFAEELLFRGIIQKNAENVFGKLSGLLYTALIFTTMHIGWKSFPDLIFVFCVAIFYGYAFQKTRSLSGVTLSHGLSNTFLFIVVPFMLM